MLLSPVALASTVAPSIVDAPIAQAQTLSKEDVASSTVKVATNSQYCSCVSTARNLGVDIPLNMNASDFKPNSTPVINGLVILQYPKAWHVAVITGFTDDGFSVVEGNYKPCQKDTRVLKWNDPHIVGFWVLTSN